MGCLVFTLERNFHLLYLLFNQILSDFHHNLVGICMIKFWIKYDIMILFINTMYCGLILLLKNHVEWLKWWLVKTLFFFRFRDSLESDTIVVHAIQSDHKISSYRLVKPSKYSRFKRASQSERRASKLERFEKEGIGRKDSQKDTGNLNDKKAFKSSFFKISKPNCIFVGRTLEYFLVAWAQSLFSCPLFLWNI